VNDKPPLTATGVALLVVEPSPSWPKELSPQQKAGAVVPVPVSRHVCCPPAAMSAVAGGGGGGLIVSLQPEATSAAATALTVAMALFDATR
jgi:hypothetical protein